MLHSFLAFPVVVSVMLTFALLRMPRASRWAGVCTAALLCASLSTPSGMALFYGLFGGLWLRALGVGEDAASSVSDVLRNPVVRDAFASVSVANLHIALGQGLYWGSVVWMATAVPALSGSWLARLGSPARAFTLKLGIAMGVFVVSAGWLRGGNVGLVQLTMAAAVLCAAYLLAGGLCMRLALRGTVPAH